MKKYTQNKVMVFMIILVLFVLIIIPVIRFILHYPPLIGEKSYYDVRISKTILEKGLKFEDNLIFEERDYIIKPYHLILAPFAYFLSLELLLVLIPFITGILSLYFFYLILKKFKINKQQIFFTFLILILSPAFIFTFGTTNEFCISIMLLLLGTYFFIKSDKLSLVSLIIFLIATILNIINALFIVLLLLFLSDINNNKRSNANLVIGFILVLTFLYYTPIYFQNDILFKINFIGSNTYQFISDLGGFIGLGIFTLILGIIGLIMAWKYKKYLKNIYILILLLFFIGFYLNYANIYLNLIFSIFAGIAISHIIKRRWEVKSLKNLTLIVLICGLLFSTISYTTRISISEPTKDIQNALEWLRSNSKKNELILSHYSKGFWIEYLANRKALTDNLFNYKNMKQKLQDSNDILSSRNLDTTKRLMNKYNIKYIFIDPQMKNGQVWNKKQGLLYCLGNNETFKSIYNKKGVEIWEYKG